MNVSEFRKNMKATFDAAVRDEPVVIERSGVEFLLIRRRNIKTLQLHSSDEKNISLPKGNTLEVFDEAVEMTAGDIEKINMVKPNKKIKFASTAVGPNEFASAVEAGKSIPKCCTLKNPCKHWSFDGDNWVNTITGEVREPEA